MNLLPLSEIINLAKKRGVYLGRGTPQNRVAYFVKTGLIPHAIRKTNPRTGRIEAHFPLSILETIEDINHLKRKNYSLFQLKEFINHNSAFIIPKNESNEPQSEFKHQGSPKFLIAALSVLVVALLYSNFMLALNNSKDNKVLGVETFVAPALEESAPLGNLLGRVGGFLNIFRGGSFVVPLLGKSELETSGDLSVKGKGTFAQNLSIDKDLKVQGIATVGRLVTGIVDPYLIENDGTVQSTLEIRTNTSSLGPADIVFEPGGLEKLRIKENGNVLFNGSVLGIGSLTMGGNLNLSSTSPIISIGDTGVLKITDGTNTLLKLTDNGTTGNLETSGDLKIGGNITLSGVINSNTFTSTKLVFAGDSPLIYPGTTNTGISLNANGTGAISIGNSSTGDIYLGGGSTSTTRCFVSNSSGNLTCSGTITGNSLSLSTVLSVSNGGTGKSTLTSNGVLYGQGTSALAVTSQGTSGQLLLANSSQVPTFVTLSSDATISSTGALTLSSTGVTAASYGGSTAIPVLTIDAKGRITSASTASISSAWSSITDPTANLALTMAANTSTFTYNAATGTSNLFTLTDTASNTGTGYLLSANTASLSTLLPFRVQSRGNSIIDTTATGGVTIGNSTSAQAVTVDAGTATLNVGNSNNAKTINIGTGTAADTINIGSGGTTADTITIGGLSTTAINTTGALTHTGTGSFSSTLSVTGATTLSSTISAGGNLTFSTDNSFDIGASGATRPRSLYLGTSAILGTTPATAGEIRLPSGGAIDWRNAGNTANDSINYDGTNQWWEFQTAGSARTRIGLGHIAIGVNSAVGSAGLIRVPNNPNAGIISARNAANTSDVNALTVNASNQIELGATTVFATDNSFDIGASGATRPRSGYFGTKVYIGTNPATDGQLNIPNNGTIAGRNAANTADLYLIRTSTSNDLFIGTGPSGENAVNSVRFAGVGTTASAANAFLESGSQNSLLRSTSSLRYKNLIGNLSLPEAQNVVLNAQPIVYTSKSKADNPNTVYVGFAAEQIATVDSRFVTYDEKGLPNWVQYPTLTAPLTLVAQNHEKRLINLESETNNLLSTVGLPTPTPSASPTPTPSPLPNSILSRLDNLEKLVLSSSVYTEATRSASSSASFDNLTILKKLLTTDLGITGKITNGLLAINGLDQQSNNGTIEQFASINTLSNDLYLQNLGVGGVNILSGKILIDKNGNLTSSSTITSKNIEAENIKITKGAGSSILPANSSSVDILSDSATVNSRILITPTTLTDKVLTITQKGSGKFTVSIKSPDSSAISFDWFIIQ